MNDYEKSYCLNLIVLCYWVITLELAMLTNNVTWATISGFIIGIQLWVVYDRLTKCRKR